MNHPRLAATDLSGSAYGSVIELVVHSARRLARTSGEADSVLFAPAARQARPTPGAAGSPLAVSLDRARAQFDLTALYSPGTRSRDGAEIAENHVWRLRWHHLEPAIAVEFLRCREVDACPCRPSAAERVIVVDSFLRAANLGEGPIASRERCQSRDDVVERARLASQVETIKRPGFETRKSPMSLRPTLAMIRPSRPRMPQSVAVPPVGACSAAGRPKISRTREPTATKSSLAMSCSSRCRSHTGEREMQQNECTGAVLEARIQFTGADHRRVAVPVARARAEMLQGADTGGVLEIEPESVRARVSTKSGIHRLKSGCPGYRVSSYMHDAVNGDSR